MKKEIINPDTGDWAEHEVAYSDGVVVHRTHSKRVFISGLAVVGDGIETQTRKTLEKIEGMLNDLGGSMEDVVRVRVYINKPEMDEESLETVHNVRREFFIENHYPSSTLIEVEDLVNDDFLIEIDADAVIPEDNWEVEKL